MKKTNRFIVGLFFLIVFCNFLCLPTFAYDLQFPPKVYTIPLSGENGTEIFVYYPLGRLFQSGYLYTHYEFSEYFSGVYDASGYLDGHRVGGGGGAGYWTSWDWCWGFNAAYANNYPASLMMNNFLFNNQGATFTLTITARFHSDDPEPPPAFTINVIAVPPHLTIDNTGSGSEIVFKAWTNAPEHVGFEVDHEYIGGADTTPYGTGNVAILSWWGRFPSQAVILPGKHVINAYALDKIATETFEVEYDDVVGIGNQISDSDPSSTLKYYPEDQKFLSSSLSPGVYDEYAANPFSVADPVNAVSGNFAMSEFDLTLKSRFPLFLARTYNSLDTRIGALGRGWSMPFLSRLEISSPTVTFVNFDGSRVKFQRDGDSFIATHGVLLQLSFVADTGNYNIFSPANKALWSFDSNGKIISMSRYLALASDTVLFTYDSLNRLQRVANPLNQWFEFCYDGSNHMTAVNDSAGRTLSYAYDDAGNLISYTNPLGQIASYEYDSNGFMTKVTHPGNLATAVSYSNRRAVSVTNANGSVSTFAWATETYTFTYIDQTSTTNKYQFDSSWKLSRFESSYPGRQTITKSFVASDALITGYTNALGYSSNYSFDTNGLIQSITDFMGNVTTYEWDPALHRITKKTDPMGREWRYAWNEQGNLVAEIDPDGGATSYSYDVYANRVSKTDPLNRTTRYLYDSTGNQLIQVIDPLGGSFGFAYDDRGNLLALTDSLSRITSYEYDVLDKLTKATYPDGRFSIIEYDTAGNITIIRDNLGRETHYTYDPMRHLTSITRPDNSVIFFAYDPAGRRISQTDSLGRVTSFEYDQLLGTEESAKLTKIIYPDGTIEPFEYDVEGRLISKHDELGNVTSFEYDPLGRLLATIDPTGARWESQYDAVGRKIADKDPLNRVTSYQFDVLDRITKVTRPDGSFVSNSFDAVGNLLSTVDALGNVWSWAYDNLNRQIKAIHPNGASSTTVFDAAGQVIAETDALGRTTQHSFDLGGRKTATTDAMGNVWRNSYDNAGRLIAVQDPMGAVSSMSYDIMDRVISQSDQLGNLTSFEFDAAGRCIAKIDAMGRRSITTYNLRDRVMSEVDPEGHTVSYGYNLAGQKVSLTDAANRTWRWDFDTLGRITSEVDPLGNTNRYAFDSIGNRVSWTNARNQTTTYAFNSMNRLSQISYPDGTVATLAYDLEGREISRSGPVGMVTKTYDSVGNMTSEAFSVGALLAAPKKWQYSFDLTGNRIGAIDPEGKIFKYQFDNLNRMIQMGMREASTPRFYDEIKFSFDPAGRLIEEIRPGVKTTNTFDLAGRLLQLNHERDHGHEKIVALRRYTYSPVGNRLSMLDEGNGLTRYFYNGSDWLMKAVYPDGQQVSYGYNGAGDRIEEQIETPTVKGHGHNAVIGTDTVTIPLSYDAGGRLISRASDTFVFDPDGNQVTAVENGDESRYFWTPDNHLTRIEKDIECQKHSRKKCRQCPQTFTMAEEYSYLPESWKRITRKTGDQSFVSIYDGDDEALEYQLKPHKDKREHDCACRCGDHRKPHLNLIREFIGGPGTDDLMATRYHRRNLWHLTDALGSIIGLTNRGGNVVSRIGYDVFGNLKFPDKPGFGLPPLKESDLDDYLDRCGAGRAFENFGIDPYRLGCHHGCVISPYLFGGRRMDSFTQLYGHRNRMYSPKLGRFVSRDMLGFAADSNLFRFVKNNPVRWIDPYGLCTQQLELGQGLEPWVYLQSIAANGGKVVVIAGAIVAIGITSPGAGLAAAGADIGIGLTAGMMLTGGVQVGIDIGVTSGISAQGGKLIGQSFGKLGQVVTNPGLKITEMATHAVNQAITRGVTTPTLLNTVRSPLVVLQQSSGNFLYLTNDAAVVLSNTGKVVSTYSRAFFDESILGILKAGGF